MATKTTQPTDALILDLDDDTELHADWLRQAEHADRYWNQPEGDESCEGVLRRALESDKVEVTWAGYADEYTVSQSRGYKLTSKVFVIDALVGDRTLEVRMVQTYRHRYEGLEGNGGRIVWGWTMEPVKVRRYNLWRD